MMEIMVIAVKCLAAILAAVYEGNGAVYFFNKMPPKWFCDYGQEPSEEMISKDEQRIKSYPWKFVFTMLFVIINIRLVVEDVQFAIAASLSLWILLELSISDVKFRIVPDELLLLLAVGFVGFIPYISDWKSCIYGAAAGFIVIFLPALAGKLAYKRDTVGGGDIKLFVVLGMICGVGGVLTIFVVSSLLSSAYFTVLIACRKIKRNDTLPLVPHIAIATGIYYIFLWGGDIFHL